MKTTREKDFVESLLMFLLLYCFVYLCTIVGDDLDVVDESIIY